jgi:hypothetical protein
MKQTRGFVTDDGTFFEREREAELYEAEFRLRAGLIASFPNLNQEPFFAIVLEMKRELLEYLNAYFTENATKPDPDKSEVGVEIEEPVAPPFDEHPAYINSAEEDLASILKLPVRRHSNVSDVGSSTPTEEVSNRSALDGP